MSNGQLDLVVRHIHKLANEERTDGQLLEQFSLHQEESAFAALVRRHGPMVLAGLTESAVRSVLLLATGQVAPLAAAPLALADGVLKHLLVSKLKIATIVLLFCGLTALGVGAMTHEGFAPQQTDTEPEARQPTANQAEQRSENKPASEPAKDAETITLKGRVLDAQGKPAAKAEVASLGTPKLSSEGFSSDTVVFAQATADKEGRFETRLPRAVFDKFQEARALAGTPGNGLGAQLFTLRDQEVVIRLPRERIVHGRLVDLKGEPAVGVKVFLSGLSVQMSLGREATLLFWDTACPWRAWPGPVITDKQGRFTLRGLTPAMGISLLVRDEPFARHWFVVEAEGKPAKEISFSLAPAQIVEGRVTYEDTGKPVAKARLSIHAGQQSGGFLGIDGQADEDGRFRLNPFAGEVVMIAVNAPVEQPYFGIRKEMNWPKGSVKQQVNISLPRGILVRGKLQEASTGVPVEGAVVEFHPLEKDNPFLRSDLVLSHTATSDKAGNFKIAVLPGSSHLLVRSRDHGYLRQEIGELQLVYNKTGGRRYYPEAVIPLMLKPATETHDVQATLRRGVTVEGRLLDPAGKPVAKAFQLSKLNPRYSQQRSLRDVEVTEGRFELRGCDPEQTYTVYFLNAANRLGATALISPKEAKGVPVIVRLTPCGSAVVRYRDADGKPSAGLLPPLELYVTPGAHFLDRKAIERGAFVADTLHVANFDRENHWDLRTDREGKVVLPALISGAPYVLGRDDGTFKEFTVESGKTLQLPDVIVRRGR